MPTKLPCGHLDSWVFRLTGYGHTYKYCIGCLAKQLNLIDYGSKKPAHLAIGKHYTTVKVTEKKEKSTDKQIKDMS